MTTGLGGFHEGPIYDNFWNYVQRRRGWRLRIDTGPLRPGRKGLAVAFLHRPCERSSQVKSVARDPSIMES